MFTYKTKSGKTYSFDRDELIEMLEDWSLYSQADNLPKWLVANNDVKSLNEAKRFITLLVK